MFFNLDTGDAHSTGKGLECWAADGNFWIATSGVEISITQFPTQQFCDFLDQANTPDNSGEYLELSAEGLEIALEETDTDGRRNLCFAGRVWLCLSIQNQHLAAFAKFLREQL